MIEELAIWSWPCRIPRGQGVRFLSVRSCNESRTIDGGSLTAGDIDDPGMVTITQDGGFDLN